MNNLGFLVELGGRLAQLCLYLGLLLILVGRLRGTSSKDRVANYIQECINDPTKKVYYDDNMHLIIEHVPSSQLGENNE